ERPVAGELELSRKRAIELARCVVARPYRVAVQRDRDDLPQAPQASAGQIPTRDIVDQLPRTDAPDDRDDHPPSGLQRTRATLGDVRQVERAIQRPQVGVDAIELGT